MKHTKSQLDALAAHKAIRSEDYTPPQEESDDDILEGGYRFELSDLYAPNGRYTPEEKVGAVMAFMTTGTSKQAFGLTNIPASTIRWWKNESSWWGDVMQDCRRQKQDELDAKFTDLVHTAIGELEDRVKIGNHVLVDGKKGKEQVRVPMNGKDLAVTLAVIFDKRQLLRGDPTQRVIRVSDKDRLEKLQKQFEEMANQVNARDITEVVYEEQ